jgi:hypothetical protein
MAISFAPQSSGALSGTLTVGDNSANATEVIQLSGTATTSDPASGFPPDGKLGFRTVTSMPMPAYLQTVTDPTFGNLVTRISDQSAFGTTSRYLGHEYAKLQVWNADGSRIFLTGNQMQDAWNTGYLLDGNTGQYLRTVHPGALGWATFRWSNVNPDNAYGVPSTNVYGGACNTTNRIVVWHPKSDTASYPTLTVLHTFTQYDSYADTSSCANMSFGLEEGNFSNDDSLGVVVGWSTAQKSWGMTTFNMVNAASATPTITERATYWFGPAGGSNSTPYSGAAWNNVSAMPKGDGVVVEWNAEGFGLHQGIEWYDPDLTTVKNVTGVGGSHYDEALDANGNEMLVVNCGNCGVSGAFIAGFPIGSSGPSGPGRVLLGNNPYPAEPHVSCRNQYGRPGWCYLSDMQNNTSVYPIGYEQIYALKLDGSQTVEVFGVDHGSFNTCQTCNAYTAKAVPSRDGERVVFGSDWGAGSSAPALEFMAAWP